MVEEILALLGRLVVEWSLKVDVDSSLAAQVNLLDAAAIAEEEVLDILVGNEAAATDTLHHQGSAAFLQVVAPEVVATFKGCLVIYLLTLAVDDGITHIG